MYINSSSIKELNPQQLPVGEDLSNFASDRSFEEMSAAGEFEEYFDNVNTKEYLRYIPGKSGARYERFCAFSMQPQNYPNAVNFVSSIILWVCRRRFNCNLFIP